LSKKLGTLITLNSFKKLRENMHLFKNTYKKSNNESIGTSIIKLNSKYLFIKKTVLFSYFFKTAMLKIGLKGSKVYRKNIINLMRYTKMSKEKFYKKGKKYKQKVFRNFFSLHFPYILYNLKSTKIFYESYCKTDLVDATVVIPIKR
jgi:hypothetical protein